MHKAAKQTQPTEAATVPQVPENLPEGLLPFYDWYQARGRTIIVGAAVAVVAAAAVFAFLRYRDNQAAEASMALASATTVEGLENLNQQYGGGKIGPVIRLNLAKAYYDAGSLANARSTYEDFIARHPGHQMVDNARLGLAATLEAQQAFEEARAAFEKLAAAGPSHFLYPLAIMGQARCLAALGQKPAALDLLDRLLITVADTPWEQETTEARGVIERFEGFRSRSILEQIEASSRAQSAGGEPPVDADTIMDRPVFAPAGEAGAPQTSAVPEVAPVAPTPAPAAPEATATDAAAPAAPSAAAPAAADVEK